MFLSKDRASSYVDDIPRWETLVTLWNTFSRGTEELLELGVATNEKDELLEARHTAAQEKSVIVPQPDMGDFFNAVLRGMLDNCIKYQDEFKMWWSAFRDVMER